MIVHYTEQGWEVFTQRAHGLLAAEFALQWKTDERPERWMETLLAIAEHDDAEIELESEHLLTPIGGPLNYAMKTFDLQHCESLYHFALMKSRYIALLTSMHMVFLYREEANKNPAARKFLQEQEKLQRAWLTELKIGAIESKKIYALLEWCDACSLILCQRRLPPEERPLQISCGPGGKPCSIVESKKGALHVDPWPFAAQTFSVGAESRLIGQLTFKTPAEFRKAFLAAPVTENKWTLSNMK